MKFTTVPALAAALVLAGCASPDPAKIKFSEHSSDAVVLVRVEPARIDYDLNLMEYDEAGQSLKIGLYTRAIRFHVKDPGQAAYLALTVTPGTYVFQDVA